MTKEIILPWTCETGNKIKNIFKWAWLIGGVSFFFILNEIIILNPKEGELLFNFGLLSFCFLILWIITLCVQIGLWSLSGRFPSFKCKPDSKQ